MKALDFAGNCEDHSYSNSTRLSEHSESMVPSESKECFYKKSQKIRLVHSNDCYTASREPQKRKIGLSCPTRRWTHKVTTLGDFKGTVELAAGITATLPIKVSKR